jgi:hypothetical protein
MQNYNPVIVDAGGDLQILNVSPSDAGLHPLVTSIWGDSGVPPKPGQDLSSFDTHIHTIGVGLSGPPWTTLMSRITLFTDGLHFETPAPTVDLQNFYLNDLIESFKGASPQMVQHKLGTYYPEKCHAQDLCWINSSARWLTVALSWQGDPNQNQLVCNLAAPDGTLIDISSRTSVGSRRRVISMPLPTYNNDRLVNHVGRWRLHITGKTKASVPYQVFWLVDDRLVHFEIDTIKRMYHVGDKFVLKGKLFMGREPLPAQYIKKCDVSVSAPVVDMNRFLQQYHPPRAILRKIRRKKETLELFTEDDIKQCALAMDREAVKYCTRRRKETTELKYKNGELTSSFVFDRSGMYQFDLHVSAIDGRRSQIVRTRTINVWVQ